MRTPTRRGFQRRRRNVLDVLAMGEAYKQNGRGSAGVPAEPRPRCEGSKMGDGLALVPELRPVFRLVAELLGDADELVVLGDAVGAGGGPGFDLAAVGGDGDVADRRVFGLARAVGEDGAEAVADGHVDGGKGLAERADLVDLHQDRVGSLRLDALLEELDVGDEQVVADKLDLLANAV